jgi:hypothetical protein
MTVLVWLLDSDPAIRWQVLRDLVHAPAEVVAAERARVATEGWGARLLALQGEDGQWAGGACFPARSFNWREENQGQPWTATLPTLQLLRDFGIDPCSDRVRRAVAMVRDHCRWEHAGQPFFSGEVEPCINGRTVTLGTHFDQDVDDVVARLLGEQLEDGGWNCEVENGSVRSSFATTINVLEGLLAHERATGGSAESIGARRRGEEFLLRTSRAVLDDRKRPWSVSQGAFELILLAFTPGADKRKRPEESPIKPAWRALAEGDVDAAEARAKALLKTARSRSGHWDEGNLIHHGHLILGHLRLRAGDEEGATEHLLAAGRTRGSPQLNSFGPNMTLAKALLERGQRQPVLDYFRECAVFWTSGIEQLAEWQGMVEHGGTPDFGPNLDYGGSEGITA